MATLAQPDALPPNLTEDGSFPDHPSDVLIDLVAALLIPMFLGAAGGDLRYARLAALETVWSYKVSTQADLLTVVEIIAFSLSAVNTLCLSMTEDVPVNTLLRLNLSADRLSRAEERARKARQATRAAETVSVTDKPNPPQTRPAASSAQTDPVAGRTSGIDAFTAPIAPHPVPASRTDLTMARIAMPRASMPQVSMSRAVHDDPAPISEADSRLIDLAVHTPMDVEYESMRTWALGTVAWDVLNAASGVPSGAGGQPPDRS